MTNATVQRARLAAEQYRKDIDGDIAEIVALLRRKADEIESNATALTKREQAHSDPAVYNVHDLVDEVLQTITQTMPSNMPITRLVRHARKLAEAERTAFTAAVLS